VQAWLDAAPSCSAACARAPSASQSYHGAPMPSAVAYSGGYQHGKQSHDRGWQRLGGFRAFHVLNAPLTGPRRSSEDREGGPDDSSELRRRRGRSVCLFVFEPHTSSWR
jgi:hypothetical protein